MNAIESEQMISESRLSRLDSKIFVIAVTLTGFLLVAAMLGFFSYQRQLSIAEAAANELARAIESDLHHNENFADAVSVLYMRLKRDETRSADSHQEYDRDHNIYGVNLYEGQPDRTLRGTLQSVRPLTQDTLRLAHAIDMATEIESKDSRYSKMERRYFFSRDNQYIYIANKMPLSQFVFQPDSGKHYGILTLPQYGVWLNQKLRTEPAARSVEVSPVYIDSISGSPVITVQHAVLDQNRDDIVLGWLCFDYQQNELQGIVQSLGIHKKNRFLNVFLLDKQTNTEFRIVGESSDAKEMRAAINERYEVIVSISPLRYYLTQNGRTDLIILALIMLCFIAIYLIYSSTARVARERALRDPLTGLYNRSLLQKLESQKAITPGALVMIDCDEFKFINDTHGHPTGDSALRHIGQSILGRINRETDYAIRMGGDEFLIVFENASVSQAQACMERIEYDISLFSSEMKLAISYGVTEIAHGMPMNEAIAHADSLMYNAKRGNS